MLRYVRDEKRRINTRKEDKHNQRPGDKQKIFLVIFFRVNYVFRPPPIANFWF